MALLFAADRVDHVEAEIVPNLMDGVTVITDRYDHSSVAYQSITGGGGEETLSWVKEINRHARRPDLTIVLDIEPAVSAKRRADRGGGRELYDDETLQEELCSFYKGIEAHFPNDNVVHVDASGSVEETADAIMHQILVLRNEA